MAGFTFAVVDNRGNEYPDAFWSVIETHLKHRDEWARIIVAPWKDREAFAAGRESIAECQRIYEFWPTAQPEQLDSEGVVSRAALPPYSALFSEAALSEGNPFVTLYGFILSLPEFAGARMAKA